MFQYIRGCLPKLFNNFYIRNVDIHSHVTRQQYKLHTHKCRTSAAQKAIRCYGVILWNDFSSKVCFDVSFTCYKRALKTFLFNQAYFSVTNHILWCCYFLQIRKCNFFVGAYASGRFVLFVIRCDIFYLLFYLYNIFLFSYCISNDDKYLLNWNW